MSELESPQPVEGGEQALPPAPPPPSMAVPPRRSRGGLFFFGALSGCLLVFGAMFFLAVIAFAVNDDTSDISLGHDKVAVIPIEGEIVDSRDTLELLKKYSHNASVKAIVMRINSPGGAVSPSQEIYSAIRRTRSDSGKPVIASLDSVAASGGFYIAAACDEIVANPGSITGSIGVIMQWFDMKELVNWAKLKPETIISGAMKDAGSPYRELTAGERQYFQSIVTQLHQQFVRDVAAGRRTKMKYAEVEQIADGRVFTGEEALRLHLIDQLGTIDDAVRVAGRLGGINGEPGRIWPKPREEGLLHLLAQGRAESLVERIVSRRVPQFLYHW